jgi:ribosomal protein L16/L10AE
MFNVGTDPHEEDSAACKALRATGHKIPVILRVIATVQTIAKCVYLLSLLFNGLL